MVAFDPLVVCLCRPQLAHAVFSAEYHQVLGLVLEEAATTLNLQVGTELVAYTHFVQLL